MEDYYNATLSIISKSTDMYTNYAQNCYRNTTGSTCALFVKPRLSWQADRNASCPFAPEICLRPYGNLQLDTGYVNSHDDLGINMPPAERFEWRAKSACSPLKLEGYMSTFQRVEGNNSVPYALYHYGGNITYAYLMRGEESQTFTKDFKKDYDIL